MDYGSIQPDAGPDSFFRLPQELRDTVYHMIYGEERCVQLVSRRYWVKREEDSRHDDDDYVEKPFPNNAFTRFLVDKRYFAEAVYMWMRTKTLRFDVPQEFDSFMTSSGLQGYIAAALTRLELTKVVIVDDDTFLKTPNLRVLKICFISSHFHKVHSAARLYEFSDAELARSIWLVPLLKLRGIRQLNVHIQKPIDYEYLKPKTKAAWDSLEHRVISLLHDITTRPRERPLQTERPRTLDERLRAMMEKKPNTPPHTSALSDGSIVPLRDDEVPQMGAELVRLVLLRPEAVSNWMKEAKEAKEELARIKSFSTNG